MTRLSEGAGELRACPFDCDNHGGRPVVNGPYGGFQVSCNACNARGPIAGTKEHAAKLWNARPVEAMKEGGVPRLESSRERQQDFIREVTLMICEIPDRNSPDDQPEMMLVTGEDIDNILSIVFERFADRLQSTGRMG